MRSFAPRWSIALALAVMAVVLLSARVPDAEAHALAVSSTPTPNSKLTESPKTIAIEFSEAIEPSVTTIQLWDQQGKQIQLGQPRFGTDPKHIEVDVPVKLESAIYTVIWRNLSKEDGHTWAGSFPFTVLGPNGQEPAGAPAAIGGNITGGRKDLPSVLDTTARWSVLVALSVIIGGIWFALGVVRPSLHELDADTSQRAWETTRAALVVSGVIACLLVVEGSLLQLALKAQDFGGLDAAHTVLLDTRFGNYLIARLVLAAITFACFVVAWRAEQGRLAVGAFCAAFAGGVGLLMTHSLVSHAASGDGAVTAVTVDALHLAAATFWIGALILVLFTLPRWIELMKTAPRTLFLARAFHRFSAAATISVALLLASGVVSATMQAPTWSALYDSNWGRSLLAKLGLTLLLLAAGGVNAYWLRPRVVEAARQSLDREAVVASLHRRLLNTIRIEALAGAAVLAAAAALIQLQSPRDGSAAAAFASTGITQTSSQASQVTPGKPFTQTRESGVMQVFLDIDPAKVGENTFTLGLGSEFGNPPKVIQARLQFDHQSASTGQSRLELDNASNSAAQVLYKASGANLSLPGEWKITANFRLEGQDDLNQTFDINLPGAPAATTSASTSIWDWPLRNAFSDAMLALGLVVVGAVVVVQVRGSRRGP